MKDKLKEIAKRSVTMRRAARWVSAATDGYPDWPSIIAPDKPLWEEALSRSKGGPKVLIATSVGSLLPFTTIESLLCAALTLRGAEPFVLLCDTVLPACLACDVTWYPDGDRFVKGGPQKDLCKDCFKPAERMYRSLGLTVLKYGDFLTPEDHGRAEEISLTVPFNDIAGYRVDGLAAGEHALAGALRFYARASLDGEPFGEAVLRRYFKASLLTLYAMRAILERYSFESAVFHHGIYVPQGLIGEAARAAGVRVVNWNPAYRKKSFIFSHCDTYHHTLICEPVSKWEAMDWDAAREEETMRYLKSRWYGTEDWIWFHEKPEIDFAAIERELGVDFSKPCIGMLTNVMWDAQLHYPANAFPGMLDWVLKTIGYFKNRPDLQLIIRVHPAEIRGTLKSRQPIVDEIRKAFPELPKNVFVIPPESNISTYAAMEKCNTVIIYGTKTGVELTSIGTPVIVAGEAWIRNKGLTMDADSEEGYYKILDRLPLKPEEMPGKEALTRARRYAYHFFFRRMIPLEFMSPKPGRAIFKIDLEGIRGILPGASPGLDVICDGILKGTDFIHNPAPEPAALI